MKNPVKFGKYYLLERINVGGMAEVFKAKSFGEAGFERLVAVKRILPSIAEDQEFIAMFIDEAKLAVQLTHPNIAQIFELGKVGEAYFIALEYVAGKDLRTIFDRARKRGEALPIPMACYIVMKICEGLDYAHNKKDAAGRNLELVHRDVSPQNMLISFDGDVKLIDFGIAKAASKSSKTQAGILKGKFGYMSPEQVSGLGIDRRSDIFGIGICLYELLTMERLFVGESDFSTLEKVRNVEIMPPTTYNRKIPEELEQIVLKALAKHPEDRYRTAMDLHDALQSFMYTSGNFFARKDLSAYMHRLFADEIAKEAAKDEEYRKFDSKRASDLDVFDGAQAPAPAAPGRNAPPQAQAQARASVPPPPPPAALGRGGPGAKATMLGMGMSPPTGPAVPSPAPAMPRVTMMGAGPVPAVAPPPPARPTAPPPAAPAPAAGPGLDMDWDDEELATQVYDKPDGLSFPLAPPPPAARPVPAANGHAAAKPAMPAPAANPAQFAGPRAQTAPMPAAAAPKSLPPIPAPAPQAAPLSPTMAQPAVAPPMPSGMQPMMNGGRPPTIGQPAVGAPMPGGAFPSMGPGAMPPSNVSAPFGAYRADPNQQTAVTPHPERKRNPLVFALAGVGALALLGGGAFALRALRTEPTGTLAISTNVPDVMLIVDDQPRPGTGMSYTVPGLTAGRSHRVIAQRVGYRTRQLDVVVGQNEVTPVQIVLEPENPAVAQPGVVPTTVAGMGVPPVAPPQPAPIVQPQPATPQPVVQPQPVAQAQPVAAVAPAAQPATQPVAAAQPANSSQRVRIRERSNSESSGASTNTRTSSSTSSGGGGGTGWLSISTQPAGRCTVAGQTFSTPRLRLELPAGTHRVSCSNPEFNVSANFSVTIRPGQETREIRHPLN